MPRVGIVSSLWAQAEGALPRLTGGLQAPSLTYLLFTFCPTTHFCYDWGAVSRSFFTSFYFPGRRLELDEQLRQQKELG